MGCSPLFFWLQTIHLALMTHIQINACYFTNVKINLLFLCSKTSAFITSFGKQPSYFVHLYSVQILLWEQGPSSCFSELFMNRDIYSQVSSLLFACMKKSWRVKDYRMSHVWIINLLINYWNVTCQHFFLFVLFLTQLRWYVSTWLNGLIYYMWINSTYLTIYSLYEWINYSVSSTPSFNPWILVGNKLLQNVCLFKKHFWLFLRKCHICMYAFRNNKEEKKN